MKSPDQRPRPDQEPESDVPGAGSPEAGPQAPPRGRKAYRSPRLVTYGRLAEITRFGGSRIVDSGGDLGNQQ